MKSHTSRVDHQERRFEVVESIYHVTLIIKKEVLKLQSLYITCWPSRKSFKVAEFLYHVLIIKNWRSFKVAESIYHVLIIKRKFLKLRRLFITCWLSRKKFQSCGVYISRVDHQERIFKSCGVRVRVRVYKFKFGRHNSQITGEWNTAKTCLLAKLLDYQSSIVSQIFDFYIIKWLRF